MQLSSLGLPARPDAMSWQAVPSPDHFNSFVKKSDLHRCPIVKVAILKNVMVLSHVDYSLSCAASRAAACCRGNAFVCWGSVSTCLACSHAAAGSSYVLNRKGVAGVTLTRVDTTKHCAQITFNFCQHHQISVSIIKYQVKQHICMS